ncbi:MAG TPA: hypothetical protein VFL83_20020 [Anaeromyxobacter sp.]|nr:hypothetical protein [Anaeromyxobacter sp.]
MDSLIVAIVTLWFFVTAGYAGTVGVSALRTRTYAPDLGLGLHGGAAVAAGIATLLLAAALFAAGVLVTFVATRA